MIEFFRTKLNQFFARYPWWGKLLGLLFGYIMAGPSGALLGLLVGNLFDKGLRRHFNPLYWQYQTIQPPPLKQLFFKTTFWVLGYIAKSDGYISRAEIDATNAIIKELGLTAKQKTEAQQLFHAGKAMEPASNPLKGILSHFQKNCERLDPELLHFFLDIQYQAAKKDNFGLQKKIALDKILGSLGFAALHFQSRFNGDYIFKRKAHDQTASPGGSYTSDNPFASERASASGGSQQRDSSSAYSKRPTSSSPFYSDAYAILGVQHQATQQEIKRAYRRLISQNHPDKLIAQNASEAMIKAANEKTQKIRKAYEQICQSRGWV